MTRVYVVITNKYTAAAISSYTISAHVDTNVLIAAFAASASSFAPATEFLGALVPELRPHRAFVLESCGEGLSLWSCEGRRNSQEQGEGAR